MGEPAINYSNEKGDSETSDRTNISLKSLVNERALRSEMFSYIRELKSGLSSYFSSIECIGSRAEELRSEYWGNGRSMIVTPGLFANDSDTLCFRNFFEKLGYNVHGWGSIRNMGNVSEGIDYASSLLKEVFERDKRPVIGVGFSLGGIYVREAAKRNPKMVDQLVTMGSPFNLPGDQTSKLIEIVKWMSGAGDREYALMREEYREPPEAQGSWFYSTSDGVVYPEWCMQEEGDGKDNVEIDVPHLGIMYDLGVLEKVAVELRPN